MAASVTTFQLLTFFNVTESTGGSPAGITAPSVFQEMNQSINPAATHFSVYKQALGSTLSPDFTAAQGTNGNINATNKRLLGICIVSAATNTADVNIATGATNGYPLPQPIKVKPGGFVIEWFGSSLPVVDATHKTVDITGNGSTTPEIGFIFG